MVVKWVVWPQKWRQNDWTYCIQPPICIDDYRIDDDAASQSIWLPMSASALGCIFDAIDELGNLDLDRSRALISHLLPRLAKLVEVGTEEVSEQQVRDPARVTPRVPLGVWRWPALR